MTRSEIDGIITKHLVTKQAVHLLTYHDIDHQIDKTCYEYVEPMLLTQFKLGHSFLEDTITYQGRWWKKYCDEINMRQVSSFRYWHTCWVEMLSVQPVALIARCVIASENDLLTTVQCTLGTVIRVTVQFIFHVTYQITFHGYLLWWWSETSFPFGRVLCHWCCTHVLLVLFKMWILVHCFLLLWLVVTHLQNYLYVGTLLEPNGYLLST